MKIIIEVDDNEYLTKLIIHNRIHTIARELAKKDGKDYDSMSMYEEIPYWNKAVDMWHEEMGLRI